MAEVLTSMTANSGATFNSAGGRNHGSSSVNLRGLGPNRTLTLINGMRQPIFPSSMAGNVNFTDVSDIPTAAVERIEISTGRWLSHLWLRCDRWCRQYNSEKKL